MLAWAKIMKQAQDLSFFCGYQIRQIKSAFNNPCRKSKLYSQIEKVCYQKAWKLLSVLGRLYAKFNHLENCNHWTGKSIPATCAHCKLWSWKLSTQLWGDQGLPPLTPFPYFKNELLLWHFSGTSSKNESGREPNTSTAALDLGGHPRGSVPSPGGFTIHCPCDGKRHWFPISARSRCWLLHAPGQIPSSAEDAVKSG